MDAPSPLRGPSTLGSLATVALLLSSSGCLNYSFQGGSFPDHIRTIAIVPFDNETTRLELTQDLYATLNTELPRALGVQPAAAENADAVVQGTITGYDLSTPNYRPGQGGDRAEVLQRQVSIVIAVQIIDRVENVILWESTSLRAQGHYLEQSQTEDDGKREALETMVQSIVDGAQSNW